ncbi:MOSC domain-containing protein [Geomicrobium sediminis]|uniref:MOSC domain-containing protein YiiM n=1 Tax=Geomicrobium sediminis TaxID=1347788 RepID=A0ABS2PBI4_9BACL|nr:MOSC domain-containing protein [Geomicrobium sediminis]MBM7632780.1 MOSC domain-containing protein YiiM [Geomicrobium sediminis]
MYIERLSTSLPKRLDYGNNEQVISAIAKEAQSEAFLTKLGFTGDDVADKKHHGGLERAVCFYPHEHYSYWEEQFNLSLPKAAFGENITVSGLLEREVYLGNIYRVGDAMIQITQARTPCRTIVQHTGIADFLVHIIRTGFTGYLAKVLHEGTVYADSTIELLEEPPIKMSVLRCNEIYYHERENLSDVNQLLQIESLAEEWRDMLNKRKQQITNKVARD